MCSVVDGPSSIAFSCRPMHRLAQEALSLILFWFQPQVVISRIGLIFQPIDSFGFHESKHYVKLLALLQILRYLRLFLSTKLTFNPEVFADAYGNTQLFDRNMFYYSFMKCL